MGGTTGARVAPLQGTNLKGHFKRFVQRWICQATNFTGAAGHTGWVLRSPRDCLRAGPHLEGEPQSEVRVGGNTDVALDGHLGLRQDLNGGAEACTDSRVGSSTGGAAMAGSRTMMLPADHAHLTPFNPQAQSTRVSFQASLDFQDFHPFPSNLPNAKPQRSKSTLASEL